MNTSSSPAELVSAALHALQRADAVTFRRCAALLDAPGTAGGRRAVEQVLTTRLNQAVSAAWRDGWQPADIVRMVRRRLGARHVRLAARVVAAEMRAYPPESVDERWRAQLAALDDQIRWDGDEIYLREGDVSRALQVLHVLGTLPRVERLCPLPGTAGRTAQGVDQRTLTRVRALLAKAESTSFPAEAETFTSAAQSLMARHSIDTVETDGGEEPQGRRLGIDAPYEVQKAALLDAVASANRCRAVRTRGLGLCTVFGYPADLDAVELLFGSLLIQATAALAHAGRDGRSRTRSFRGSFLAAYAQRIGERLRDAAGDAVRHAGKNLLPVLAAREQAVDAAVTAMFPELTRRATTTAGDWTGWTLGLTAADLALIIGVDRPSISHPPDVHPHRT
ncbi:DUF2786 domain-containing protein [Streptosporangium sp. KLBMP 9127]|nr:DUF2786 domain-containing protein [Streptosporangium sp. KLBMP 9127]